LLNQESLAFSDGSVKGYDIKTVPHKGWVGIKNGQLLGISSQ